MKKISDIKYGVKPSQILDVYIPKCNEFPVFVYFHGGGFDHGSRQEEFIPDLVEKGIAVVSADYTLYPEAHYPEYLEDGALAVLWTKENINKYGQVKGIYIGGSSAGGYLSQMLCFCDDYFNKHNISLTDISGFYFDAGQPTTHFSVLKERGIDPRTVIIDDAAPLFHIKDSKVYPPIEIVISDNDIEGRYEQTLLLVSALKQFKHNMDKVYLNLIKNSSHCEYVKKRDNNGKSVFANMVYEFIKKVSN